jgi:hypothetical protein
VVHLRVHNSSIAPRPCARRAARTKAAGHGVVVSRDRQDGQFVVVAARVGDSVHQLDAEIGGVKLEPDPARIVVRVGAVDGRKDNGANATPGKKAFSGGANDSGHGVQNRTDGENTAAARAINRAPEQVGIAWAAGLVSTSFEARGVLACADTRVGARRPLVGRLAFAASSSRPMAFPLAARTPS